MSTPIPWTSNVRRIKDGSPVSAANTNRPLEDLSRRTEYLRQLMSEVGGVLGSLMLYDQPVEQSVKIGAPVYVDPADSVWRGATVDFVTSSGGVIEAYSAPSQVMGVLFERVSGLQATVLVMGEMVLTTEQANHIIEGGYDPDTFKAGSYYLSVRNPGKLTHRWHVAIQSAFVGTLIGPDTSGRIRFLVRPVPLLGNPMTNHVHYRFDLVARPAGTVHPLDLYQMPIEDQWDPIGGPIYGSNEPLSPFPGVRQTIATSLPDEPGWLPVRDAEEGADIPPNAKFFYNMKEDPDLLDRWPPIPWEDATVTVNGNEVTPDLCTVNKDGIWWMDDCWGKAPWPVDYEAEGGGSGTPATEITDPQPASTDIISGSTLSIESTGLTTGQHYVVRYSNNGGQSYTYLHGFIATDSSFTLNVPADNGWYTDGVTLIQRVRVTGEGVGVVSAADAVVAGSGVRVSWPSVPGVKYILQKSSGSGYDQGPNAIRTYTAWSTAASTIIPDEASTDWRVVGIGSAAAISDAACFVRDMRIEIHFTRNLFQSCATLVSRIEPKNGSIRIVACDPDASGDQQPASTGHLLLESVIRQVDDEEGQSIDAGYAVQLAEDSEDGAPVLERRRVVTGITSASPEIEISEETGDVEITYVASSSPRYGVVDLVALDNVSEERLTGGGLNIPLLHLQMPSNRSSSIIGKLAIPPGPIFPGQAQVRFLFKLDGSASGVSVAVSSANKASAEGSMTQENNLPSTDVIPSTHQGEGSFYTSGPLHVSGGDIVSFQLSRGVSGGTVGILSTMYVIEPAP